MLEKSLLASKKPSSETEKVNAQEGPAQSPSSELLNEGESVYPSGRPLMPPGRPQGIMKSLTAEVVDNLRNSTKNEKSWTG